MSLLNKASLIQIPSGYKDGTLYSAKPTNGDGDFTFSRGSNLAATRVNSDGLIEKGRENLVTYSNDLTQWGTFGFGNITATTDPLGGNKAFILDDQDGGAYYRRESNGVSITGVVTSSVYIKKTTGSLTNYAGLEFNGEGVYVIFDTTNGTYNLTATSPYLFINVETAYDDWWRVSLAVSSFTSGQKGLLLWPAISSDGSTISASATGSNIFYAPQTEQGLVATDYIETGASTAQAGILEDMPRLDYSGGASCPSLLLEPQRTNLLTQSEYFGSSDWVKTNGTIEISNELSPQGKFNAYQFTESTGTINPSIRQNLGASTTTDMTLSVFVKANGRNFVYLAMTGSDAIIFNISDGTIGTTLGTIDAYSITDMGNGWYRCSATKSTDQRDANFGPKATNAFGSYTGDGTSGILIYGAMLESSASYPTSYIPTYGASVTRGADSCSKTGISSLIGQTEGTMFVEFDNVDELDVPEITLDDGTNNNRIVLTRSFAGYWALFTSSAGSGSSTDSTTISNSGKFAIAYNATNYVVYKDGTLLLTRTASLPVSLTDFRLNGRATDDFYGNKIIKQAVLFPTRLSNDELSTLTTI